MQIFMAQILSASYHTSINLLSSRWAMASRFNFYSFPGYEFLILTITFFDIKNSIVDINICG